MGEQPGASDVPAAPGGRPDRRPGRAAFVVSQLYYYTAAVVGVGFLIGGGIEAVTAIRTLVLPREFETQRDALRQLLRGVAFALPGLAVLWWHLREARGREGRDYPETFWGRSVYYHLVALVALGFVLGGTVGVLHGAVDAAVPPCYERFEEVPAPEPPGAITRPPRPVDPAEEPVRRRECEPSAEGARRVVNGALTLVVAAPIFVWHLREGRRATRPVLPAA